uniref:Zinc finger protein 609 n=1 Tax=Pelodiscus sinensis TaxID=13735 RepID=K7G1C7_PELSI
MSLSSGAAGGKGVDANPVETYDSGDEWDIGVGNLIIDLDADLEKDQQKLEMSGSKEVGLPAPNAVATLPDNIKFVTPVPGPQGKEGKSKSKRSKSGKDSGKPAPGAALFTPGEGTSGKKEVQGRSGDGTGSGGLVAAVLPKGTEKSKAARSVASSKKEKEGSSSKSKKERSEGVGAPSEKEPSVLQPLALAVRVGQYDAGPGPEPAVAEQLGSIAIDTGAALNPLGVKSEMEDGESECRQPKKVKAEKMESPVSTPAVLPLHLLVPVVNNDIASPCEQIMVRTRSVGVNTCDVALATEPECLGPCEPGTSVNLEGIVWQETEDGMLVVNVTWRNKTYVGTLLDCTQHDWAPPRFCDSPTSDLEMRNGRGRGKRMRPNSSAPVTETAATSDSKGTSSSSKTRAGASSKGRRGSQTSSEQRPPPSGAAEDVKASPSSVAKRKSKPLSDMELNSSSEDSKGSKRIRTNSMGSAPAPPPGVKVEPVGLDRNCPSPILIDCPHPNCNKKYKHINGLKYHQAHAHTDDDSKPEADGDSECGEELPPQRQSKDSPYSQGFDAYYSPGYPQASPGPLNPSSQAAESQAAKLKKEEEQELPEGKGKSEGSEEKKVELSGSSQQPSVIQQRPSMYMQSLYYNQYAYVPPYGYSEQGYHAHLLSTSPAPRQRQGLEVQPSRGLEKKAELGLKEDWKPKPSVPPTLTKAPSLTDLVKSGLGKAKEVGAVESAKSVIIPKLEDSSKLPSQVAEGLKVKVAEAGHLGKEAAESKAGVDCGRQAEADPVLWYRQSASPRL